MTDKTQPEALRLAEQYDYGDPATHGNAWKAAVCTELRSQHARMAELEAELEAVGAGGVQALSAAPNGWKLVPVKPDISMQIAAKKADMDHSPLPDWLVSDWPEFLRIWNAMLAASPTPPAEQQAAPKAAPGEPVHGDVLPPVGSRVYIRHGRDNDAHACTVTGYYAWGDLGGDKRLHRVFVRLVYEGTDIQQARMLCDCYPTAEAALAQSALQQEAQEPFGWVKSSEIESARRHGGSINLWRLRYDCDTPLYTAPQPAPALLSERDAFEAAWEKLHGKRPVLWSQMFDSHKMETPAHSEGKYFAASEQAAWKLWQARAAIAAHGDKA